MPADLDLLTRANAATDPAQRQATFAHLCHAVERAPELVERVVEVTAGWSAAERRAPPYTINKLVDGRLPYGCLTFIGSLRLFDLILDEATAEPAYDRTRSAPNERPYADRFAALRRWADDMPTDVESAVEHID